jgi:hypothetical protein
MNDPIVAPTAEWLYPGKRSHTRIDVPIPVYFCPYFSDPPKEEDLLKSNILDISMGGILFHSNYTYSNGQYLWIRFDLAEIMKLVPDVIDVPTGETLIVDVIGEVRQCEEHLGGGMVMGVKFDQLINGDLAPLKSIIEQYG